MIQAFFQNHALWTALLAWFIAQLIKPIVEFLATRRWNWGLWFSSGGMPSSHSALVCSVTMAVGLFHGFDTPVFALSVAMMMIVVYDAAGVRREAGRHAEKINILIEELFQGQPISEQQLKEVIGHSPLQVTAGVILGFTVAIISWLLHQA